MKIDEIIDRINSFCQVGVVGEPMINPMKVELLESIGKGGTSLRMYVSYNDKCVYYMEYVYEDREKCFERQYEALMNFLIGMSISYAWFTHPDIKKVEFVK